MPQLERVGLIYVKSNVASYQISGVNKLSVLDMLFKRQKTRTEESYYVLGSGLVKVPLGRLNETRKVIQEFHEAEAARARLEGMARGHS
jgi:hypothetical protein